jgi:hypothetical protein
MTDPLLQIVTTTASAEEARRIATALLERRLAAGVQIVGPVGSFYRWQGKIETARGHAAAGGEGSQAIRFNVRLAGHDAGSDLRAFAAGV